MIGDECDRLERWASVSRLGLRGFELATPVAAVVVAQPSEGSLPPPTCHHRPRPDQAHCQGLAAAQTPAPGTQASPMTSPSFVQLLVQAADSQASSRLQPWAGSVTSRHCSPVSAAESLCDWTGHLRLEAQDTGVPWMCPLQAGRCQQEGPGEQLRTQDASRTRRCSLTRSASWPALSEPPHSVCRTSWAAPCRAEGWHLCLSALGTLLTGGRQAVEEGCREVFCLCLRPV